MLQQAPIRQDRVVAGILLALAGTALFTPVYAAGKFVDGAVPALAIVAMRYIGGLVTVITVIRVTGTPLRSLKSAQPHWHAVRAMLGAGGGICTIHATSVIPIADATAIGLLDGIITVALAAILLGERVTVRHWLAGVLCALGALLVVRANASSGIDPATAARFWEGAVSAFVGAVLIAIETLFIKILARREHALGVLIHVNAIAAVLLVGPGLWAANHHDVTIGALLPFLILGPIAITAQFCNILALRYADAAIAAPINYSWILFATALGVVWFGEVPTPWTLVGAAMIVAGGIWLGRIGLTARKAPS